MSRRLVNRARGAGGTSTQNAAPDPLYQPPSFPLNDEAISKLGDVSRSRNTLTYQNQIKDALRHLGLSVYDLQSRLSTQRTRLDQMRASRQQRGTDKQPEEERLENHISQLETEIDSLTRRSEAATRSVIDQRVALEDHADVLSELYTTATTRRPPTPPDGADQDDLPQSVASTLDTLRDHRAQKKADYEASSHHQRYALDNDYISFKKLWHDGAAGDAGPPLPDASRWFRTDGTPVMTVFGTGATGNGTSADGDHDDDDDVAVAREVLSLNCPLTLRPLEDPYTSRKCGHTFEYHAIQDYLKSGEGSMQCPQTGCSETFTRRSFNQDFYLDQVILRRIQRAKQAQEDNAMDMGSDDDDDDDDDVDVAVRGSRPGPGGGTAKQEQ